MKKYLFLVLLVAGCGSTSDSPLTTEDPPAFRTRARGGAAHDAETLAGLPKTLDPGLLQTALSPKATSTDLSPVLDQGYLESCGAFGLAYETCGYEIRKARGLTTAPGDCLSPAFMYRKVLDLEHLTAANDSNGTYAKDYFNFLVHHPPVNLATLSYPAPTTSAEQAAVIDSLHPASYTTDSRLTIGSWSVMAQTTDPSALKAQIDAGHVVGVLVQLPGNFDNFYHNTGVFRGRGSTTGGHFMSVVDYDDSRQAFRVQNSWGSEFGDQGFMWWAYPSFMSSLSEAYVIEPVADAAAASSGGSLSGGEAAAKIISLHQARQDNSDKVYLIFRLHLGQPLHLDDYTITTPGGHSIHHSFHGHSLHSGRLFLSRQDGQQWPAGRYTFTVNARDSDEHPLTLSGSGQLSPLAGLPSAEPDQVLGSDEQVIPK